jgi:DNA-binding NarL/FixJ family response regulator
MIKKIMIVDDHPVVRSGMVNIINQNPEYEVEAQAGGCEEALGQLKDKEYDLVILDLLMPDGNGLDVLKQIKTQYPKLPVIIMSIQPEDTYAVRSLKAGAAGYLQKNAESDEVMRAIKMVMEGRRYVTANLSEKLASRLDEDYHAELHELLSDREYEVLTAIAMGKSVKQIAQERRLSAKTISTYHRRGLNKMHMASNAEFIRYALEHKLLS